jgi:hypothetical protein
VIVGLQQLCSLRILDGLGDLVANEIGRGIIGGLVDRELL